MVTGAAEEKGAASRWSALVGAAVTNIITLIVIGASVLHGNPAQARYASLVVDGQTGMELYAKNADTQRYPASLTKIMTLYMTFEALKSGKWNLNTPLKISERASSQPQTRLGLKPGQTITVHEAILALVTRSANDVATAIGENLAGTELRFAEKMTRKAQALGMTRTTFRNASGLPNRAQVSTARDMVTLARAIRRDFPRYYPYFRTTEFQFNGRVYKNHNTLLERYEGTEGIKTGYTNASGYNLVASVRREGKQLIGVVFGGKTGARRDRHMINILDRGFEKMTMIAQLPTPPLPEPRPSEDSLLASDTKEKTDAAPLSVAAMDQRETSSGQADRHPPAFALPVTVPTAIPREIFEQAGAPVPEERGDSPVVVRHWGIQVGAYSSAPPARAIIATARDHLGPALGHARERVERVQRRHGTIYRARIMGLREVEARDACAILVTKHLPCVPVPGDLTVASAPD